MENELKLPFVEYRQLAIDYILQIKPFKPITTLTVPSTSLLAISNKLQMIIYPLANNDKNGYNLGWSKLSIPTQTKELFTQSIINIGEDILGLGVNRDQEDLLFVQTKTKVSLIQLEDFKLVHSIKSYSKRVEFHSNHQNMTILSNDGDLKMYDMKLVEIKTISQNVISSCFDFYQRNNEIYKIIGHESILICKLNGDYGKLESSSLLSLIFAHDEVLIFAFNSNSNSNSSNSTPNSNNYFVIKEKRDDWNKERIISDPTHPRSLSNRPNLYFPLHLKDVDEWELSNLLLIANYNSQDIGTIARLKKSNLDSYSFHSYFLESEEYQAQMPLSLLNKDSFEVTFPIGLALDKLNPIKILNEEGQELWPTPIAWFLNNEGFLIPFRIVKINSKGKWKEMCERPFPILNPLDQSKSFSKSTPPTLFPPTSKDKIEKEIIKSSPSIPSIISTSIPPSIPFISIPSPSIPIKNEIKYETKDLGKIKNAICNEVIEMDKSIRNDINQLKSTFQRINEIIDPIKLESDLFKIETIIQSNCSSFYHQKTLSILNQLEKDILNLMITTMELKNQFSNLDSQLTDTDNSIKSPSTNKTIFSIINLETSLNRIEAFMNSLGKYNRKEQEMMENQELNQNRIKNNENESNMNEFETNETNDQNENRNSTNPSTNLFRFLKIIEGFNLILLELVERISKIKSCTRMGNVQSIDSLLDKLSLKVENELNVSFPSLSSFPFSNNSSFSFPSIENYKDTIHLVNIPFSNSHFHSISMNKKLGNEIEKKILFDNDKNSIKQESLKITKEEEKIINQEEMKKSLIQSNESIAFKSHETKEISINSTLIKENLEIKIKQEEENVEKIKEKEKEKEKMKMVEMLEMEKSSQLDSPLKSKIKSPLNENDKDEIEIEIENNEKETIFEINNNESKIIKEIEKIEIENQIVSDNDNQRMEMKMSINDKVDALNNLDCLSEILSLEGKIENNENKIENENDTDNQSLQIKSNIFTVNNPFLSFNPASSNTLNVDSNLKNNSFSLNSSLNGNGSFNPENSKSFQFNSGNSISLNNSNSNSIFNSGSNSNSIFNSNVIDGNRNGMEISSLNIFGSEFGKFNSADKMGTFSFIPSPFNPIGMTGNNEKKDGENTIGKGFIGHAKNSNISFGDVANRKELELESQSTPMTTLSFSNVQQGGNQGSIISSLPISSNSFGQSPFNVSNVNNSNNGNSDNTNDNIESEKLSREKSVINNKNLPDSFKQFRF